MSSQLLNHLSKSLFQYLAIPVKNQILMPNCNILCSSLCPLLLIPLLCTSEKSLSPSSLYLTLQVVADTVCSPLSLLFLRPNESSSLSLSPSIMFSNPCLARRPQLDSLQYVHGFCILRSSKLDTSTADAASQVPNSVEGSLLWTCQLHLC